MGKCLGHELNKFVKSDLKSIRRDVNGASDHRCVRSIEQSSQTTASLDVGFGVLNQYCQEFLVGDFRYLESRDFMPRDSTGGHSTGVVDDSFVIKDESWFFVEQADARVSAAKTS